MKVKTWTDTRTFEEKTGFTTSEITEALKQPGFTVLRGGDQVNRRKPEPEHHVYDIETVPGIEPEERFVVSLFYRYGRFKTYKERFNLPDFCQHHELTAKDINKLRQIAFSIGYKAGFNKGEGLEVDQYRNEIFEQLELFCRTTKQKKTPASLEDMFANKKHLNYLVKELTAKGFCHLENGSLTWTGKAHHTAKKPKSQIIALAYLCQPYYKKLYQQKELWQAWTTYFNIGIAQNMFTDGKRPAPDSVYNKLFETLINSLRTI